MKTILLDTMLHPDGMAILSSAGHTLVGPMTTDSAERRKSLAEAHAIIVASGWPIDDAVFSHAPNLQVVGRPGIGLDNVDLDAATKYGVCVVHTPDAPTQSTAEHAFTLLLALAKRLLVADSALRARGWNSKDEYAVGVQLKGRTLGLVGLGRIGGTVARMGQGFDMRVIVFDPYINPERAQALGVELRSSLREVLAESDFVSLHTALMPQTRAMIGKAELETMKSTAFLINCSRGPVIDERALLEVLRAKRIAGAGLDVFTVEPTPQDNPLLQLENVVVTPHIASRTADGVMAMGIGAAEEVCAVLSGRHPRWLANHAVWEKRRR
jgi:D-3-phosphoglycerate dehydrogenase